MVDATCMGCCGSAAGGVGAGEESCAKDGSATNKAGASANTKRAREKLRAIIVIPPSAGLAKVLVIQILAKPTKNASIGNDYCAVARRHQFPFLVSHDEPDEIGPWFDVETGLYGDARTVEALESGVEQLHFENLFAAGYEIPILTENDGGESDAVMIAAI